MAQAGSTAGTPCSVSVTRGVAGVGICHPHEWRDMRQVRLSYSSS